MTTQNVSVEVHGIWSDYGYEELELEVWNRETGVGYALRAQSWLGHRIASLIERRGPVRVQALPDELRMLPYQ